MRKLLLLAVVLLAITAPARAAPCPGVPPWSFSDVDASDPFCAYMTWMAQQGITSGCKVIDSTHRLYCPADAITRSQMAAFMARLVTAAGQQLTAVVKADGTLVRGAHAVSATRVDAGNYEVVFDRSLATCAFTASIAKSSVSTPVPGQVALAPREFNANALYLVTTSSAGAVADKDFQIIVSC